jgi:hypothetical protein
MAGRAGHRRRATHHARPQRRLRPQKMKFRSSGSGPAIGTSNSPGWQRRIYSFWVHYISTVRSKELCNLFPCIDRDFERQVVVAKVDEEDMRKQPALEFFELFALL